MAIRKKLSVEDYIRHIRNFNYMGGIDRSQLRKDQTGEHFTPTEQVKLLLDQYEEIDPTIFSDPSKTIIDPVGCGDGQFLAEVLIRKLENGIDLETALSTIYGVDIMQDNVNLCKERLLCGKEDLRHIVNNNIVCADALRYHYRFDGTDPYKTEQDLQNEKIFEIG